MPTNAINDTGVKYLYDKLHGEIEPIAEAVSDSKVTIEGNPLNFSTLSAQNAESTIIDLEPIQDLHGYDKPWVGGAGKNLLPMTVEGIKAANSDATWTGNSTVLRGITFTILTDGDGNVIGIKANGTSTANNAQLSIKQSIGLSSGTYILNGAISSSKRIFFYDGSSWYDDYGSGKNFTISSQTTQEVAITISTSGTTVNNEVFYPMIRLSTESDATFAPYENICPISGRSEIGILGCGKNLLPMIDRNVSTSDYTISIQNGEISVTKIGTWAENKTYDLASFTLPIGEYKINGCGDTNRQSNKPYCTLRNASNNAWIANLGDDDYTLTVTDSTFEYKVQLFMDKSLSLTGKITPMLRKSSNANTFEPYTKSTDLTIDLGSTVYGGTLGVENGVLVVTHKQITMDGVTIGKKFTGKGGGNDNNYFLSLFDGYLFGYTSTGWLTSAQLKANNMINSHYDYSDSAMAGFKAYIGDSVTSLQPRLQFGANSSITTLELANQWLADQYTAGTPWQFTYPLATPITIQLTPHTINLLKGVNNISTDGDKITLTYRDGSVATLGDLTSAVDSLDGKIEDSKILTDTVTGDKYILVVSNGVLDIQQISN